jgi:CCR4-NOT transcription complex subunit 6
MADGFARFNPGGQFYYNHHPRSQHHRNGSPTNNTRSLFQPNADTPSPNRSPGTNSPAHNAYGMYNHGNHRQNHGLLNGGAAHQGFQMNMHKPFQSQSHGHNSHHVNNQHQEHGGMGGQGSYGNHQHNMSASTLSNTTPHFTPAHLQNGTPDNAGRLGKASNEQYDEHLREYNKLKMGADKPHWYARNSATVQRTPGVTPSSASSRIAEIDEHGTRPRATEDNQEDHGWDALDLGGHGLRSMGQSIWKFYPRLKKLYFNHNRLNVLPPQISIMHYLTILDVSFNGLTELPPEIGMLTNLKRLLLFDNQLQELPYEIGFLYQLEFLGLEGNPMRRAPEQMDRLVEQGTHELVRYLREEAPSKFLSNHRHCTDF